MDHRAVPLFRLQLEEPFSVQIAESGSTMLTSVLTKIYPVCTVGLSCSGKSFLLNSMIILLASLGYLRREDHENSDVFVSSSRRGGDFGITRGSDIAVVYLREEGDEPWAGGAIVFYDFEGLMMDDHPGLSVLLALATQLATELLYVDCNFNDSLRNNLSRLVAAGLVQCDGRAYPNWPFLTVIINQRQLHLATDALDTMFDETRGDASRQQSTAAINQAFTRGKRRLLRLSPGGGPEGFDGCTSEEILNSLPIGTEFKPRFCGEILPSLLSRPFSVNGVALTGPQYVLFVSDLVQAANEAIRNGNYFARPTDNFEAIIAARFTSAVNEAVQAYANNNVRPILERLSGQETAAALRAAHDVAYTFAMGVFADRLTGFTNWETQHSDATTQLHNNLENQWIAIQTRHSVLAAEINRAREVFSIAANTVNVAINAVSVRFSAQSRQMMTSYQHIHINESPSQTIGTLTDLVCVIGGGGSGGGLHLQLRLTRDVPAVYRAVHHPAEIRIVNVPEVRGVREIPAVYRDRLVAAVWAERTIPAVWGERDVSQVVGKCQGHYKSQYFGFNNGFNREEADKNMQEADNLCNQLTSTFTNQKNKGDLSDFAVEIHNAFTLNNSVRWCTFCPNNWPTCDKKSDGQDKKERYMITEERVERYEKEAARIDRNAELVTPPRQESYVQTPPHQVVEVARDAYTEQVLVTDAGTVVEDLMPLYNLLQSWMTAANAYEAAMNVV